MASNGVQTGQEGAPAFPSSDAPATGPDLEEVARWAVVRGNRMKGTTAERNAWTTAGYAAAGQKWYDLTTKIEYLRVGSTWVPWDSDVITDSGGLSAGTGTINAGTSVHKYKYAGGRIFDDVEVTITNAGTGGGGLNVGLPFNASGTSVGGGRSEIDGSGLTVRVQGAIATVFKYNNTTPIAVGTLFLTLQCNPA